MGRGLLAIGLIGALQAAALSAPLVHAHLGEHHDPHHAAARIHAHVDGHRMHEHSPDSQTLAMQGEDSEGRVLQVPIYLAVHVDTTLEPAVAVASFDAVASSESVMHRPPQVVRSHGPPAIPSLNPRAPPAYSV